MLFLSSYRFHIGTPLTLSKFAKISGEYRNHVIITMDHYCKVYFYCNNALLITIPAMYVDIIVGCESEKTLSFTVQPQEPSDYNSECTDNVSFVRSPEA